MNEYFKERSTSKTMEILKEHERFAFKINIAYVVLVVFINEQKTLKTIFIE